MHPHFLTKKFKIQKYYGTNKLRRLFYKDIAKTTTKYLYYNSGHVCSLHSFIHTVTTLEKIVQETQLHRENTDRVPQAEKILRNPPTASHKTTYPEE